MRLDNKNLQGRAPTLLHRDEDLRSAACISFTATFAVTPSIKGLRPSKMDESPVGNPFVFSTGTATFEPDLNAVIVHVDFKFPITRNQELSEYPALEL